MTTNVIVEKTQETIVIDNDVITVITSAEQGPPGVTRIGEADDVDKSNLENGSVLVYSGSSEKWIATRLLENQSLESGHY